MQMLTARVLVCDASDVGDGYLYITDRWTLEQARNLARTYKWKPLYIVSIWRKK